jgi:hypothetical protein
MVKTLPGHDDHLCLSACLFGCTQPISWQLVACRKQGAGRCGETKQEGDRNAGSKKVLSIHFALLLVSNE